jgi:hypothetical protein
MTFLVQVSGPSRPATLRLAPPDDGGDTRDDCAARQITEH